MTYFDQHVHTHFSFDSQAQFADYLRQTSNPFVTTEHLEMSNPDDHGLDDVPDYAEYVAEEQRLSAQFGNKLRTGIEVGYYAPRMDAIRAYLDAHDYDIILLSFHHNGHHDYQDASFTQLDPKAHVQAYYASMLAGLQQTTFADVLAHFDYGLRVLDVTPTELTAWAEGSIKEILQLVISRGMSLEVNTKSMYRWHNEQLYTLVLRWYLEMGGRLVTLGSDAHTSTKFESNFVQAKQLLRSCGVNELVTYKKHVAMPTSF
ncbi:PHP domain-containing protein [Lacticaseibacillus hulanensis]|uniref:PHP domain-containing protein n=1 Tax=Lacticaseibacillus hulanensis TaxID=2493111 RepID=UPI000FDA5A95|nr:PHP domain-containing protein [Lacticaseibacillus hulanensis]